MCVVKGFLHGGTAACWAPDSFVLRPAQLCAAQVIAHRIDTIMDCEQLLVLSRGGLVEQGPPALLAEKPGGTFARLAQAAAAASKHGAVTEVKATDNVTERLTD